MKITVEKKSNNPNTFRTPVDQLDNMPKAPVVGEYLLLQSSSHESGGILTSKVLEVKPTADGYEVVTLHSTYFIKVIKEQ